MEFSEKIIKISAEAEAALAPVFAEIDAVAYDNTCLLYTSDAADE